MHSRKRKRKSYGMMMERAKLELESLSDEELAEKSRELKASAESKSIGREFIPTAVGLVREATRRELGIEHYDVQVMGALELMKGRIAELKTGEGKTLMAVMAAYIMSLSGRGVHVVTVNEYLAQRDGELAGRILKRLDTSVGIVLSGTSGANKKKGYASDVTYVTNSEVAFDYLRDNMTRNPGAEVQRELFACIIDEVDSILVDEAKTPLIIAGEGKNASEIYKAADECAKSMQQGHAYSFELSDYESWLSRRAKKGGMTKKEALAELGGTRHALEAYAKTCEPADGEFLKSEAILGLQRIETKDYIVDEKRRSVFLTKKGMKKIRTSFGIDSLSRNPEIRNAVETALKARCIMKRDKDYIVRDGEVLVVDEYTGRVLEGRQYADGLHQAIEAKEELKIQEDFQTVASITYQSFFAKYRHLSGMTGTAYTQRKEFADTYGLKVTRIPTNRPMIREDLKDRIYLTSAEKFEAVVEDVRETYRKGQPVLVGTVSVSESERLSRMLKKAGIPHSVLNARQDSAEAEIIARAGQHGAVTVATNMAGRGTDIVLDEEARKLGGLKVIGTQRHESRRIDNQLRGRSGRQGDPGVSVFYVSLEDDIVRRYMNTASSIRLMREAGHQHGEQVSSKTYARAIRRAQTMAEDDGYETRRSLFLYDRANDAIRESFYAQRRTLLEGTPEDMIALIRRAADRVVVQEIKGLKGSERKVVDSELQRMFDFVISERTFSASQKRAVRDILLSVMDEAWTHQLKALDYLKDGMHYVQYGQKDDASMYAIKSAELAEDMRNLEAKAIMLTLIGKKTSVSEAADSDIRKALAERAKKAEENREQKGNRK
jgi:preprotein translocase subunit SecA